MGLQIASGTEESARAGQYHGLGLGLSQRAAACASSAVITSFIPLAASGRLMRVMGPDWSNSRV